MQATAAVDDGCGLRFESIKAFQSVNAASLELGEIQIAEGTRNDGNAVFPPPALQAC